MSEPSHTRHPRHPEHPIVSVIVPVYNDGAGVDRLLAALAQQTLDSPYEVIVVDDASSDLTLERLNGLPRVRYLRLEQRGGSYAARNAGLEVGPHRSSRSRTPTACPGLRGWSTGWPPSTRRPTWCLAGWRRSFRRMRRPRP